MKTLLLKTARPAGTAIVALSLLAIPASAAGPEKTVSAKSQAVFAHWTRERRKAAQPRDMVIDARGLGYRRQGSELVPHGHNVAALANSQDPRAKPSGNDTTPPVIGDVSPASGETIDDAHVFTAHVTDAESGVKSVTFTIQYPSGATQSFGTTRNGNVFSAPLSGFTDGNWQWQVIAKDNGRRGGNTASIWTPFSVDTGGSGNPGNPPPADGTVTNARWEGGGNVQMAAGRIYFEMPNNSRRKRWSGYVCSGTVVSDTSNLDRSVILTAAHCIYDDANKAFARNVLFIPNQDGGNSGTDTNCNNDPIGCWVPEFGVVDADWSSRVFPANIPWDYGFYVVPDSDAHLGAPASSDALDQAVTPMIYDPLITPGTGLRTHALGYSYSDDPFFMYCAEDMELEGDDNWWLPSCGLSGGSSGGPWTQAAGDLGTGPIISVNSWGYSGSPGMAGPKLDDASNSSASCLFGKAQSGELGGGDIKDGDEGIIPNPNEC